MTTTQQRIGIDCRLMGPLHAGIGRYVESLVSRLVSDEAVTWVLFFATEEQAARIPDASHIEKIIIPVRHYTLAEQWKMTQAYMHANLDLLHVPHFNVPLLYNKPFVVTIHDLLWHEQRGSHMTTLAPLVYTLKYQGYRLVSSHAIRAAKQVIVPATTVKDTVCSLIAGVNSEKVVVTYEGVDDAWSDRVSAPVTKRVHEHKQTLFGEKKILFYTGSLYPHKNVSIILDLLEQSDEYVLALSSSRSVFVDQFEADVAKRGLQDKVKHLGRLSDEELRSWYAESYCLVQPSLSEGFGLTGVEAMLAGIPVVASNIPIFQEIYADAFLPFDPTSAQSLQEALHVLSRSALRNELIKRGLANVSRFSWDKMARETKEIYTNTLRVV